MLSLYHHRRGNSIIMQQRSRLKCQDQNANIFFGNGNEPKPGQGITTLTPLAALSKFVNSKQAGIGFSHLIR